MEVEFVLKIGISFTQEIMKRGFLGQAIEVKGLARTEDDGLFAKITIV